MKPTIPPGWDSNLCYLVISLVSFDPKDLDSWLREQMYYLDKKKVYSESVPHDWVINPPQTNLYILGKPWICSVDQTPRIWAGNKKLLYPSVQIVNYVIQMKKPHLIVAWTSLNLSFQIH